MHAFTRIPACTTSQGYTHHLTTTRQLPTPPDACMKALSVRDDLVLTPFSLVDHYCEDGCDHEQGHACTGGKLRPVHDTEPLEFAFMKVEELERIRFYPTSFIAKLKKLRDNGDCWKQTCT
jgi:hypothetical protein